jgi:hypothetical protein
LAYVLLGDAQHFLLPTGGRILDDEGKLEAKYASLCYLPFPITAFEFYGLYGDGRAEGRSNRSSKRIALCIDSATLNKLHIYPAEDDEWGCISVCYLDGAGVWGAFPHMSLVSRSKTETIDASELVKGESMREEAKSAGYGDFQLKSPKIGAEYMFIKSFVFPGFDPYPVAAAQLDTRDELVAAVQACAALACSNMEKRTVEPSSVLNEKRKRSGKEPFVAYHILDVAGERATRGQDKGGSHNSPRQHLRRGHIRRLDETRVTWVNSCVVGNDVHGKVVKDYRYSQSDASEKP